MSHECLDKKKTNSFLLKHLLCSVQSLFPCLVLSKDQMLCLHQDKVLHFQINKIL